MWCDDGHGRACGYYDDQYGWLGCQGPMGPQCDNWALRSYIFGPAFSQNGDYYLEWLPPDPPQSVPCPRQVTGPDPYLAHVGSSTRSGRRQEILYHAARLQYYWQDWLGVLLPRTRVFVEWNPMSFGHGSADGVTMGAHDIVIPLKLCAFVQRDLNYGGEALTRSVIAHEFGHVVDMTLHGGFISTASEHDTPANNKALAEAIANFSANWSGWYEYSADAYNAGLFCHGSPRNPRYVYPSGYYCGPRLDYRQAGVWLRPWTDFHLMSGPPGLRAWNDHIADAQFAHRQLRLLDPTCVNTFDYDSCPVGRYESTFYRKLWRAAREWSLGYEAVKAWQQRVVDWDVGNVDTNNCNGDTLPMTVPDQDHDFAPWFDDVPDGWWQAPVLPLDNIKLNSGSDALYGPFEFGWCTTATGSQQCDPLTLDYSRDKDYFLFYGRAGKTYRIYTMPGNGASSTTDTVLELRGAENGLVASDDDCQITGLPPYGTWFSCIIHQVPITQRYRIVVRPKIAQGRALGSKARYRLHVEMVGDDYADVREDASPILGVATGKIQNPNDLDWFYLTVFDQAQVSLSARRFAGTVWGLLTNHEGQWIAVFVLDSNTPIYTGNWSVPKGTYYLVFGGSEGATYSVDYWRASYIVEPGTTRATAIALYDPAVPTPLPSRAITNRFQSAQKHYYRFWARRNEIFVFNVFGSARVSVVADRETSADNPIYQQLVMNVQAPSGNEVQDPWGTLLEDAFGGIRPTSIAVNSSYLSFVAPWEGWYFALIEREGEGTSYVLWAPNGLVWLDRPEEP